LRDVSDVQKGAVAFLTGFNLLMCLAELFEHYFFAAPSKHIRGRQICDATTDDADLR
jgi:hypothetical protein